MPRNLPQLHIYEIRHNEIAIQFYRRSGSIIDMVVTHVPTGRVQTRSYTIFGRDPDIVSQILHKLAARLGNTTDPILGGLPTQAGRESRAIIWDTMPTRAERESRPRIPRERFIVEDPFIAMTATEQANAARFRDIINERIYEDMGISSITAERCVSPGSQRYRDSILQEQYDEMENRFIELATHGRTTIHTVTDEVQQ